MIKSSEKTFLKLGFLVLILLILFRPLTLMGSEIGFGSINVLELFAVGISYFLLVILLANLRQIPLDRASLLGIYFCTYCLASLFWGSYIQWVARVILPFVVFLSVRTFVNDQKQINALLISLCIAYIIPILLSTNDIILSKNIDRVEYLSGVTRFSGVFHGSHILAYAMIIFSFLYCLLSERSILKSNLSKIAVTLLLVLSIFCLYKSYTRTAYIGFLVFWTVYLFSAKSKIRTIIFISTFVLILISANFQEVFWKSEKIHNLNTASSGRIELWVYNLNLFQKSYFYEKLLGHGIGNVVGLANNSSIVGSSHNDYLELLMAGGVIGLLLYLVLLLNLLWDIICSQINKRSKFLFGGILASIAVMNLLSNASIFRIENAQYFWFFMGLFYCIKDLDSRNKQIPVERVT